MKSYKQLQKLKNLNSVCIITHTNPDVDALCGLSIMQQFLKQQFNIKQVDVFADFSTLPDNYLPILGKLKLNGKPKKYDGALVLDCPNVMRLGKFDTLFNTANVKAVIDHHDTNDIAADISIVEIVSSCCEIIYYILKSFNYPLSPDIKLNLYSGIITDTNNFTVGAISKRTFEVVANCIDSVNITEVYNNFLNNNTLTNMQVLARAVDNIKTYAGGQIILTHLTPAQANKLNVTEADYIGISNRLAGIANVKLLCFIRPQGNKFYVSLRAKCGLNVADFAKRMGGGGHAGAAAYICHKSLTDTEAEVLNYFNSILKQTK